MTGRRAVILLVVLFTAAPPCTRICFATTPPDTLWTAGGLRVCTSDSTQTNPLIVRDGLGGLVLSWCDRRSPLTYNQVFATRLTVLGAHAPGWPDSGTLVTAGYASDQAMASDGQGGAFLTWPIGYGVTMQHMLWSGLNAASAVPPAPSGQVNRTRALDGEDVDKFEPRPFAPVAVPDGSGGVFVGWPTGGGLLANGVYIQDVTSDGHAAPNWPASVEFTNSYETIWDAAFCGDGAGGAFAGWSTVAPGDTAASCLLGRVASNGTLAPGWPHGGIHVCPAGGPQFGIALVPDGSGGVIAFWNDERNLGPSRLYATRIRSDTTLAPGWPSAGLLVSQYDCQAGANRQTQLSPRRQSVLSDGAGGAFVAWTDSRLDTGDVFVQHILGDGTRPPGWTAEGVAVCTAPGLQSLPHIAEDGAGGLFVTWQDERSAGLPQVFVQHVTPIGGMDPSWPAQGIAIAPTGAAQTRPVIESDGAYGAILAWEDLRSGRSAIYAAHVTGDAVVPAEISLISSEADVDGVLLTWDATAHRDESFSVERRSDTSDWITLATRSPDASGVLRYEDRAVAPGTRYGYRLSSPLGSVGETWLTTPGATHALLSLTAPSPARSTIRAEFTLPREAPARLALVDVTGRIVDQKEVGGFGAGEHSVDLGHSGALGPGIYFLRLSQGARLVTRRVVLLR